MLETFSIGEIDQLLNELEELARSAPTRKHFLDAALERLKFLLGASGVSLLLRADNQDWIIAVSVGQVSLDDVRDQLETARFDRDYIYLDELCVFVVPIRPRQWTRGALAVHLQRAVGESSRDDVKKLCEAVAEIVAMRQLVELEELLDTKWLGFQQSLATNTEARSLEEPAIRMVNDLSIVTRADRVSLVRVRGLGQPQAMAVSGVSRVNRKSASVEAIEKVCQQAIREKQSRARHEPIDSASDTDDDIKERASQPNLLLAHSVCIPLLPENRNGENPRKSICRAAILLEWHDIEGFLAGATTLNYFFPTFSANWLLLEKCYQIPSFIRKSYGLHTRQRYSTFASTLIRLGALVAAAVALIWLLLIPTMFRIEGQGTLQATEQKVVFAPLDGVVESLSVQDGQYVDVGMPIASMRSPQLDIEVHEVSGAIRANHEKRDGLSLAMNQLARDSQNMDATQSRLSAEIRELETQLETLTAKRDALLKEQKKLQIVAPISGMIVAPRAERFLESRPVKRGDALLRVANLDGPWHLDIKIADRDSLYVREKLMGDLDSGAGQIPESEQTEIAFVMLSQPDIPLRARASWISEAARNADGDGMFVDLEAKVDRDLIPNAHMGASVFAYIECGKRPLWFVWSRPLIEAIQRRLWF